MSVFWQEIRARGATPAEAFAALVALVEDPWQIDARIVVTPKRRPPIWEAVTSISTSVDPLTAVRTAP